MRYNETISYAVHKLLEVILQLLDANRFMGYTKDDKGPLVIELEEAEIVKCIYLEYLQGANLKQIKEGLQEDGILTAAGKAKSILKPLRKF